jgi:hypothetical protein
MLFRMPKRFKPPSIDELAEVDVSGCKFKSKCEDIQGLISPSGQGGWDGTEEYRVHCFSLAAWRRVGGPLVRKELVVLRPASNHNWSAYPKYSIYAG